MGEFDKSESHYREWIALLENQREAAPLHTLVKAYHDFGVCLFIHDRNDDAIETLEHALRLVEEEPKETQLTSVIHSHLAQIFIDCEDYIRAEQHNKKSVALMKPEGVDPYTQIDCLLEKSMSFLQQNKHDESIDIMERALSLPSEKSDILLFSIHKSLAYLYKEKGVFDKAEGHYKEQISLMEKLREETSIHDLADAYDDLGVCLFQLDRSDEAIGVLERALAIIGELEEEGQLIAAIHNHLAQIFRADEEYEKAEFHYKENLKYLEGVGGVSGDIMSDILVNIGTMLARQDKYEECIEVTERALTVTSDENVHLMQAIHSNLAYLYKEKGEFNKAEGHYREQISLMEKLREETSMHDLADAYDDLGVCLFQLDRSSEALEALEHALEIIGDKEDENSLLAIIHNHIAQVFRDKEKYETAEYHYKESVKYTEKAEDVSCDVIADRLMKVGVMLARQEKYDECLKITERALSLTSEDNFRLLESIHSNLAYLYKEKGEYDKAERHYREKITIIGKQGEAVSRHDIADAYDDLGVCLYKLDRNKEAIEVLENALQIIEDNEDEIYLIATIHNHLAQIYQDGEDPENAEIHKKEFDRLKEKMDKMRDAGQNEGSIAQGGTNKDES